MIGLFSLFKIFDYISGHGMSERFTFCVSFPSIGDQLDMQYHDLVDGTTTWKDAVTKVKSDNPKPE